MSRRRRVHERRRGGLLSLSWIQWRRSWTPTPLLDIVEPDIDDNNNNNDIKDDNDDKGAVLRGRERQQMNGILRRLRGGEGQWRVI
jgi:hypothetical protein